MWNCQIEGNYNFQTNLEYEAEIMAREHNKERGLIYLEYKQLSCDWVFMNITINIILMKHFIRTMVRFIE